MTEPPTTSVTKEQMQNLLRLARNDAMIQKLETFYRSPDADDGPLCLAVVIMQGAERIGGTVDLDLLAEVIRESWEATP